MDTKTKDQIVTEIERFKEINGGNYPNYYIGITRDLKRRIDEAWLSEHIRDGIYDPNTPRYEARAESRDIAFKIEVEFQNKGMKEYNPGGQGKADSYFVYCFKLKIYKLNEEALPTASDMIRSTIDDGRRKEKMRWLKSFKRYFGIGK